ncbi:hypothetical protein KR026_011958 [Drosophila bipectinata]|nr:hypothetical protein KR026_011958 [Drosophila bipectinata]
MKTRRPKTVVFPKRLLVYFPMRTIFRLETYLVAFRRWFQQRYYIEYSLLTNPKFPMPGSDDNEEEEEELYQMTKYQMVGDRGPWHPPTPPPPPPPSPPPSSSTSITIPLRT